MVAEARTCRRGVHARYLAAILAAGALLLAGLAGDLAPATGAVQAAQTAQAPASSLDCTPSVLTSLAAQVAWGFMECEATDLLATQSIPAATSQSYTRNLIRSYILMRLIGIVKSTSRTSQEKAAYDFLKSNVIAEQHGTAQNAYNRYLQFNNDIGCTGTLTANCWASLVFGTGIPTADEFGAEGYVETFQAFNAGGSASKAYGDMLGSLDYWGGLANSSFASGFSGGALSASEVMKEVFADQSAEAAREIAAELVTMSIEAILEKASPELIGKGGGAFAPAIIAIGSAVIFANALWNSLSNTNVGNSLLSVVNSTATTSNPSPDLSLLTSAPGLQELSYVVASQTMPQGSDQTNTNTCSFSTQSPPLKCFSYTVPSDPDSQSTLYGATPAPPAQTPTDPFFQISAPGGTKSFSQALEPAGRVMPVWTESHATGSTIPEDVNSARGLDTLFHPHVFVAGTGLISSIHNGMVVTSSAELSSGGSLSGTWLYRTGFYYTDPSGNIWKAWYQNGTFLQLRIANYLGTVQPSNGCSEDALTGITNGQGDCLLGLHASLGNLSPGDEVSFLGEDRIVASSTPCGRKDKSACQTYDAKAVLLQPGPAAVNIPGEIFNVTNFFLSFFKNALAPAPTLPVTASSAAYQIVRFNSCAGRQCTPPPCTGSGVLMVCPAAQSTDLSVCDQTITTPGAVDCFRSPTIGYQALDANNSAATFTARLISPPAAQNDTYQADANNSAFACCSSSSLTVDAAHGFLANDTGTDIAPGTPSWDPADVSVTILQQPSHGTLAPFGSSGPLGQTYTSGAFSYTPASGFGWNNTQQSPAVDSFTYRVCHSNFPTTPFSSFTESNCSTATVTIDVRNAPPTANPVTIGSNTAPVAIGSVLSVTSYTYADREGDVEGVPTFEWFRNGIDTGVSTPTYKVAAADAGATITAVVTPVALTGSSPGVPATSNGIPVPSNPGTASYQGTPTSDGIVCSPAALYYPASPAQSTTCTATVVVSSTSSATTLTGSAAFRTTGRGTFGSTGCTLGNRQATAIGLGFQITASCSVSYTPTAVGNPTIVAKLAFTIGGGFGTETDYRTAGLVVTPPPAALQLSCSAKILQCDGLPPGTPLNESVTVVDAQGQAVPGYTGTIHFASDDAQAVLPADYTFTAADHGTHLFVAGITLKTARLPRTTVTVSTVSGPALPPAVQLIAVPPGPANSLQASVTPASAQAGTQRAILVKAFDAYGNLEISPTFNPSVTVSSSDPQAVFGSGTVFPTTAFSWTQGVLGIPNGVTFDSAGTPTVTVTDTTDNLTATVTGLTVTPAGPSGDKFAVTGLSDATAGTAQSVTVTLTDKYGNPVGTTGGSYTGTVHFTSTDQQATLPGDYTFTAGDAGVHTFANAVTLRSAGHQTVTVTDSASNLTGAETVTINGTVSGCSVTDHQTGLSYTTLQTAVLAANPGDLLDVTGTCTGTTDLISNVTVDGGGTAVLDGGGQGPVVTVEGGKTVTLENLTVKNGNNAFAGTGTGFGGGIANHGSLSLDHVTVSSNTAADGGGGIYNDGGLLTLSDSTVTNNTVTTGNGGGILDFFGVGVTDSNSVISGNSASSGAGVVEDGGAFELDTGSSINNNTATALGGGIYMVTPAASVTLNTHAVITHNTAVDGGGIDKDNGNGTIAGDGTGSVTGNTPNDIVSH